MSLAAAKCETNLREHENLHVMYKVVVVVFEWCLLKFAEPTTREAIQFSSVQFNSI